jgi:hypothetical protein
LRLARSRCAAPQPQCAQPAARAACPRLQLRGLRSRARACARG